MTLTCDLLDWRCIIVNEIFGDAALAVIAFAILYFILASKMKFGYESTLLLAIPVILTLGSIIAGFTALYAFITFGVGILAALTLNRVIGNR